MHTKKLPMRKCLGCGEMLPKKELVRVVKTKTGEGEEDFEISLDLTGKKAGRGAYVLSRSKRSGNVFCRILAVAHNVDFFSADNKQNRRRTADCTLGADLSEALFCRKNGAAFENRFTRA